MHNKKAVSRAPPRTACDARSVVAVKIRLHAYWRQNLGDDLFVRVLCERYPGWMFFADYRRKYGAAFSDVDNLRRIPVFPRIDAILRRLRVSRSLSSFVAARVEAQCDCVVNIGGSIFMERAGWQSHASALRSRFAPNRPSYVVGANFGPYSDPSYLRMIRSLLARAVDVCFRDTASVDAMGQLPNVRHAPDVLFSLSPRATVRKSNVVISVMDLGFRGGLSSFAEVYESKIVDLAQACASNGLDVVLMSFCAYEGDERAVTRLMSKISEHTRNVHVRPFFYRGNIEEALDAISAAQFVVATRFHAMILAWVYNKPVLPISYSTKTERVIEDLGYPGSWFRIEDLATMSATAVVKDLLHGAGFDVESLRTQAEEQFAGLDRLLQQPSGNKGSQ